MGGAPRITTVSDAPVNKSTIPSKAHGHGQHGDAQEHGRWAEQQHDQAEADQHLSGLRCDNGHDDQDGDQTDENPKSRLSS
jgi:hypothetical protein